MDAFEGVAESAVFREVLEQARRFAPMPRPLLIRGERGTGKELVARFIHRVSGRGARPFVALNCAAVNDELLNAEIYGHEKGAFTGADATRIGKLEMADGGSLFLDEIGNMSAAFQDRILRVVEYQEFERVRGTATVRVDVRVISATNADVEELMAENLFRRDLYDRLTFAELHVPPLRRRRDEIETLIVHFVRRLHEEIPNLPERRFHADTILTMMEYYWPGNVRELRNVVERVYVYGTSEEVVPADLPTAISGREASGTSFHMRVEQFKRNLVLDALVACGNNQRRAADSLAMTYDQFRHYYRKYRAAAVLS